MADVFLDNKFVGTVKNGLEFAQQVRQDRRAGKLDIQLNVRFDAKLDQVFIETAKGRVTRPLVVVVDGKPLLNERHIQQLQKGELLWSDLVKQGVIEYLDASEEEDALVALEKEDLTPEHTHLEISAVDILGIAASLVPYGHHNQGVRLSQGAKNQKQGVGFYAANFPIRMDMDVSILHYPQVPIVSTILHDVIEYQKHPTGQNVTVAIMGYRGYNMEDAIVVSQGAIDRGLGRSTYYRPMVTEEMRYSGGLIDQISVPDKDVKGYRTEHDYRFLEEDGIVFPEANVKEGDVVIGKTSPPRFLSSLDEYNLTTSSRRESSLAMRHGEQGIVDFVCLTENEQGNKMVQVRLRNQRIPEIGDKFTSRHGQKGVISLIVPEQDMPFTATGMHPDILFSPHGIPNRMTVSHLIELLGGKTGALAGRYVDGTTFSSEPEKALREELARLGFREDGSEVLYDGVTGEEYPVRIFVGNMFYLRLKHMVANKIHSRALGPIELLTRQPTEGRTKEGGLRMGEMEKDTFVAHGAALLLKERFDADKVAVPVCLKSGMMGYYDKRKNKLISPIYGEDAELDWVEMSYAFKLLLDEIKSLCVLPKLILEDKF
ncbi:DNA-directed RNA polymerase subunit B [Candidatus Woesearchaeota archaeon]|nr:MAG: DNA-directed RNA polymerase subunit B [Candidatus Woesearchaeota archaeon]